MYIGPASGAANMARVFHLTKIIEKSKSLVGQIVSILPSDM
jgi:hypothetical protein